MQRTSILAFLALCATGCNAEPAVGTVVNGLTTSPIGGFRLVATATDEGAGPACLARDTEVLEDGTFSFTDLCAGTTYQLRPDREGLWFADGGQISAGAEPAQIMAWPAPKGTGLYAYDDGEVVPVKITDEVRSDRVAGAGDTEELLRYAAHTGRAGHGIEGDDRLLIVGADAIANMKIAPLVQSGPRTYTDASGAKVNLEAHEFVGEAATPKAESMLDKQGGDRAVRYLSAEAFEAGRYAVLADGDRRMHLVRFGAAAE